MWQSRTENISIKGTGKSFAEADNRFNFLWRVHSGKGNILCSNYKATSCAVITEKHPAQ
jgi:hypothetical protein